MRDYKALRKKLEEFRQNPKTEFPLRPLEKWMVKELGIERVLTGKGERKKRGKGPIVTFFHPAMKMFNETGNFTVHLEHKKREVIRMIDFRNFLYKPLCSIIDWLEAEEQNAS